MIEILLKPIFRIVQVRPKLQYFGMGDNDYNNCHHPDGKGTNACLYQLSIYCAAIQVLYSVNMLFALSMITLG